VKEKKMPQAQTRLEVSKLFQAPRETVFKAWIQPEMMKQWFCPEWLHVAAVEAAARVGGKYRISMKDEDRDKTFTTFGTYKEIIPNQKLVFTWEWEEPDQSGSLVTVTFKDKKGGTEVTVLHERYVDMANEEGHLKGWKSALENLAKQLFHEGVSEREIVITRMINAPRERVFEAMTDPKQVVHWWGPNGFTTTIHKMDVRPGGVWHHTMHGPDGTDYPNKSIFKEIVRPERIVYQHAGGEKERGGGCFSATWTFEAQGEKTKMTGRLTFASSEERDRIAIRYQALEGGKQTLARLENYLSEKRAGENANRKNTPVVLERTFDAPVQKVWKALTHKDQMKEWYFDLPEFRAEVGFEFEFTASKDDKKYRHLCEVTEVITGRKLTYSWRYDGYEGNSFVTFELFAEGYKTRLKLTHKGLETFPKSNPDLARENFVQGWTEIIGSSLNNFLQT